MATLLVQNGAIAGAAAAIMAGRAESQSDPGGAEPVLVANVAAAFGAQFLTANAALSAPIADDNNGQVFMACYAASYGVLAGRSPRSVTPTDYAVAASAAAAFAKALEPKFV
jgi:hypothetical protein